MARSDMVSCDLVVIGAGPAGLSAALAASAQGLSVVILDEASAPGGQVYRAPPAAFASAGANHDADARIGDDLRARLAASSVDWRGGRRIWQVSERFRVDATGPGGAEVFAAPRLVAATGAVERVVPFPGWTLPGVIGLAGATVLLKAQGMAPGRRTVVAGCGPLLAAVAGKIVAGGGEVAAVVDLSGPGEWLAALPRLAGRPMLLRQGASWMLKLAKARVTIHFRHTVIAALGQDALTGVEIAPVGGDGARTAGPVRHVEADALAVGHGLVAGADITRLLRAEHRFDARRGGWVPVLDDVGRTSIPGLYAAGDGAAIAGAAPAIRFGYLAGLAAAIDAGALDGDIAATALAAAQQGQRPLQRFSEAVAGLMRPRPGLIDAIAPDTVVCRCEDVTRREIEAAVAAGAREVNQLKHFTRCGMGPCQGRICGDTVAELLARHVGSREAAGCWTMRPPLRPVPLRDLLGTFDYADIPVPQPAPL